jgi:hypothetical protein
MTQNWSWLQYRLEPQSVFQLFYMLWRTLYVTEWDWLGCQFACLVHCWSEHGFPLLTVLVMQLLRAWSCFHQVKRIIILYLPLVPSICSPWLQFIREFLLFQLGCFKALHISMSLFVAYKTGSFFSVAHSRVGVLPGCGSVSTCSFCFGCQVLDHITQFFYRIL